MTAVETLLIEAHEAERTRLARELHDDIGQRMAVLTMDLDALARALPADPSAARARIRTFADRTLGLAKDIEALAQRLYPPRLEYVGVVSASASFCKEVSARHGIDVAFTHDGMPEGVPPPVALSLFRVLQEGVTNAAKHAGARHVTVALTGRPEEIRLDIVDAGVGFDLNAVLSGRAPGLVGMRERARMVGGELIIESQPGAGTSLHARVPVAGSDRSAPPAD